MISLGSSFVQSSCVKRKLDLKLYQKPLELGDLVYQLDTSAKTGESRKLKPVYIGPMVVSRVISPILYQVEGKRRSVVLHHDRLRKCLDRDIPLWVQRRRHQILDLDLPLPPAEEDDIDLALLDLAEDDTNVDNDAEFDPNQEPE